MPSRDERDAIDRTPVSTPSPKTAVPVAACTLATASAKAQGLPAHVADASVLRAVAVLIAHQPNQHVARKRTSAATDRARSEKEDDRDRRPRAS